MAEREPTPTAAPRPHVVQMIDSLDLGGAERVAVDLANGLERLGVRSTLATTRHDGPLEASIDPAVGRLSLRRRWRFDVPAIRKFRRFLVEEQVGLVHAHSSSLLFANLGLALAKRPVLVWHDHYGRQKPRSPRLYRRLLQRAAAVVSASEPLAQWTREKVGFPADRVRCLYNGVPFESQSEKATDARFVGDDGLPGVRGARIVCVANLRPAKNHLTLVRAFAAVVREMPEAHLLLVGALTNAEYWRQVQGELERLSITDSVTWLGQRDDVAEILERCDVGTLTSRAEGLPIALLEYGRAGLGVVASRVGEIPAVLESGRCGVLIEPDDVERASQGYLRLLRDGEERARLGGALRQRVFDVFSMKAMCENLIDLYRRLGVVDG